MSDNSVSYTTQILLDAIEYEGNTQADVAARYAWAMEGDDVNWKVANEAIIARWSKSGLTRIKKMAWGGAP